MLDQYSPLSQTDLNNYRDAAFATKKDALSANSPKTDVKNLA